MRFYGLSLESVEGLSMEDFEDLNQSMEIIKAQDKLEEMMVHDYPHMKKENRAELHKSIHKVANPTVWSEPVSLSTLNEKLGAALGR